MTEKEQAGVVQLALATFFIGVAVTNQYFVWKIGKYNIFIRQHMDVVHTACNSMETLIKELLDDEVDHEDAVRRYNESVEFANVLFRSL
jgi:hypothetical protein